MVIKETKNSQWIGSDRMLIAHIQDKSEDTFYEIGIPDVVIEEDTNDVRGSKIVYISVTYQKVKLTVSSNYYGISNLTIVKMLAQLRANCRTLLKTLCTIRNTKLC